MKLGEDSLVTFNVFDRFIYVPIGSRGWYYALKLKHALTLFRFYLLRFDVL